MVYFHLLRMLIGSLGRGEMGNTIHTGISAPDTRLAESYADMSTKLSSKRKKGTDRQAETGWEGGETQRGVVAP